MNYIIISPYYPHNFQQFAFELKKQGINVLGIGQEPYEQLGDALQQTLSEYFRVNNLEDLDEVKRAVAFLFHKHGSIDRIESHNEYWLNQDAQLRAQFNVEGPKPEDLVKTNLKSEMKKYFQKANVPVVPGHVVKTQADIESVAQQLTFPFIAKPDHGVGAAATYKIATQAQLDEFSHQFTGETAYFFESFVEEAEICTYDGLVDAHGNIIFETSMTYCVTPLDLMTHRADNTMYIHQELDSLLRQYGRAIIDTFGMRERFFHVEFFKKDHDYIALEYNNRPAGGFSMDLYNYAFNTNFFAWYAQMVVGHIDHDTPSGDPYCVAVTRRDEHAQSYVHSHEDIINKYRDRLKTTERTPSAFAHLMGDILYIVTADSAEDRDALVEFVTARHD